MQNALSVVDWVISTSTAPIPGQEDTCRSTQSDAISHLVGFVPQPVLGGDESADLVLAVLSRLTTHRESSVLDTIHGGADLFVLRTALTKLIGGSTATQCVRDLMHEFPRNERVQSLAPFKGDKSEMDKQAEFATSVSKLAVSALRSGDGDVDGSVFSFNSRALVVLSTDTPLHPFDISLLVEVELKRMGAKMTDLLSSSTRVTSEPFNGVDFLNLCSFCGKYASGASSRYNVMEMLQSVSNGDSLPSHVVNIPPLLDEANSGDADETGISLVYVFDPLSLAGQRAAAAIQFVQQHLKLHQVAVLAPDMEITEFPLQNFFRYVSGTTGQPAAVFKNVPRQHTLTVRVDAPEAWNVQAHRAVQDIDNLKCDARRCGDEAGDKQERTVISYRLKSLLVAGQCFENFETNPTPPNGLQLVMSRMTADGGLEHFSDTLVMQNLGYWQLQANPGLWSLSLAAGRASALYDVVGSSGIVTGQSVVIPVRSFADSIAHLYVEKKEGMRHMSLLDSAEDGAEGGKAAADSMWNSLSGMFGGGKKVQKTSSEDETIHVFSLATGQVYERLLRIMMLSVTKRTKSPVKFWLFEYYLSPAFKQTVDAMCKQYGFEVGYVTYKWPEWLTQQTVKQRIIWGYKILFLDVLFPLEVKKVIYVDADQVVRADLKELWDMDIQGKPYAYTPFCDSREETL
jgi:hypothetical protein